MATLSPPARALSADSSFGAPTAADTFDVVASLSSTPPTSIADTSSIHNDALLGTPKLGLADEPADAIDTEMPHADMEIDAPAMDATPIGIEADMPTIGLSDPVAQSSPVASPPTNTSRPERTRRSRLSEPVYNLSKLSGTDGHGKRRSKGDVVSDRHRRRTTTAIVSLEAEDTDETANMDPYAFSEESPGRVSRTAPASGLSSLNTTPKRSKSIKVNGAKAKKLALSPKRTLTRSAGLIADLAPKPVQKGKRKRDALEQDLSNVSREIRRLQDTKEFQGIDDRPVLHTVWANGKFVDPNAPPPKKTKVMKIPEKAKTAAAPEPETVAEPEAPAVKQRRVKKWLPFGLYSGQDCPTDPTKGLTIPEKKAFAQLPELTGTGKVNSVLPPPQFAGLRLLIQGRDFRLPFDICNPLPPGQPKPKDWRTMTKNRFIGESRAIWKKTPHLKDYQSNCVCTPEDGCGESCQNRIMLYECDHTNCNVGIEHCQNRAFARLTERTKAGGKYRVGVEVIKTGDRGYGIRANRCFEPNQIIMEYTGEIITEDECDRRMNEKYKDNECYYLMLFDQNMIIDATTGSIARFVNHSCRPNCQMIKWIVSGQPRMALFAGDRPIQTGEELTYDYNFDPFSSKNVQICLCGSDNCRGVLGPKPKDIKPPKVEEAKKGGKKSLKGKGKGSMTPMKKHKAKAGPKVLMKKPVKKPILTVKAAKEAMLIQKSTVSAKAKGSAAKAKVTIKKASVVKTVVKGKAATKTGAGVKKASPKKTVTKKTTSATIVAAGASKTKTKKVATSAKSAKTSATTKPKKTSGSLSKPKKLNTTPAKVKKLTTKVKKPTTPRKGMAKAKAMSGAAINDVFDDIV